MPVSVRPGMWNDCDCDDDDEDDHDCGNHNDNDCDCDEDDDQQNRILMVDTYQLVDLDACISATGYVEEKRGMGCHLDWNFYFCI